MTNSRFKFRVWNKQTKEWSCGTISPHINIIQLIFIDNTAELVVNNDIYEIVESTGLYDCEGREIWEGDYIKIYDRIFLLGFDRGAFTLIANDMECGTLYTVHSTDNTLVIGNRFENSELLEGKE